MDLREHGRPERGSCVGLRQHALVATCMLAMGVRLVPAWSEGCCLVTVGAFVCLHLPFGGGLADDHVVVLTVRHSL